jgi:exodeoxyribonuclease VII large subunit
VVSAIGHEVDSPLLDLVADLAASTPTDAAKRIVPDLGEQTRLLIQLRARCRDAARRRLATEAALMADLPQRLHRTLGARLAREAADTAAARQRAQRRAAELVGAAEAELVQLRARVLSLSPQATLSRGYAVIQHSDGRVVRAADDVGAGETLDARLARGRLALRRA